ncbi:MAG: FxsA family protein [Sciscionella sp.]
MALVFLLYVIAEVAAVWAVASAVGVLWTIVLLIGGAVFGSWLARREGGKAVRSAMATARAGGSAHREVTGGMLIAVGGLLILIPGFISDALGLLLLLPPSRGLLHRAWLRRLERRATSRRFGGATVVEGEVVSERYEDSEPHRVIHPIIDQGQ